MPHQHPSGRLTHWLARTLDRFAPLRAATAPAFPSPLRGGARGGGNPYAGRESPRPPIIKSLAGPYFAFDRLGQPAWAPRDYAAFAREGFMQNAILYRSVRMIAESAASVPLLLYQGEEEIADHPLLHLIARPNPACSAPDLLESWYGFLLVSGNAYLEAVAVGDDIRELHTLRPDRMKVVPGADGWPAAFDYTVDNKTLRLGGEAVPGVRRVLHSKLFHPLNDHYGLSPIEAAASAVDIHNTASRWNKALLDNSARPSGALVYTARDGNLTIEQYDRLKAELEQGFQGAAKAGRPLLLEGGLDWKSMSMSPKDMDFIEAKHVAAREIALALGVPPMLLGIPGDNTYAADWSEYFGHQPPDGSDDVHFHLDPLWSSDDIDAIGIDVYWPLADWRDGRDHADRLAGAPSIYDLAYLTNNLAAGEGYDWYYADLPDRDAQVRTPITDGGAGKPWVFRFKDIRGWWLNPHFDRPGGIESGTPTAWVPQSKPFWFMELGCPAVDNGANQPNVFIDPKSSESHLPHFSHGRRDDFMQRRYLQAFHEGLDPEHDNYLAGANPESTVYAGRMIDLDRMHVYAWDARPHPAFPADTIAWGDGPNWRLGHWLTGRIASAPLAATVQAILADHDFDAHDAASLNGTLGGLLVDRVMSARDAIQPLELAFFFDTRESDGRIVFTHRGAADTAAELAPGDLVEARPGAVLSTLTRAQETDLPASAKITYITAGGEYPAAVEEARRLAGRSGRVALADLPLALDAEQAAEIAEVWLFEAWAARERAQFALPPSRLALEPGDVVDFTANGRSHSLRITEVGEHGVRDIEARGLDPDVYASAPGGARGQGGGVAVIAGKPFVVFLDLPLLRGDEPPAAGYVAAAQDPWPGPIAVYRSPEDSGFQLKAMVLASAVTGVTLDPLPAGATSRFDRATAVRVKLDQGALASVTELALLAGANLAAIQNDDGAWEVLQFQSAVLTAPATYTLTGFLRGQAGTEHAMRAPLAAGARFVLLDGALARVDMTQDEIGLSYNWKCGPASRDIGSPHYLDVEHTFTGEGLEPLSPVHVRGARNSGDLDLTWVRRTRIGGDSWDDVDVPLGEDDERYEIDILDGSDVVRTLTATSPAATYTSADQTADFGSPQSSIALRIHQMSATRGRGTPREAVL
jgi:HK97 family phage portal protein